MAELKQTMMELLYPEVRQELLRCLSRLSDIEYQKANWREGIQAYNFDFVIHFLFDDSRLSENTQASVGEVLRDQQEANLVQNFIQKIDSMLDKYGGEADQDYIIKPEWVDVVDTAKTALLYMQSNDRKSA